MKWCNLNKIVSVDMNQETSETMSTKFPKYFNIIHNWYDMVWFSPEVVPTSCDHDTHIFYRFLMAFKVPVKWVMKCHVLRFEEFLVFDWYWKITSINSKVESGHSRNDVCIV